MSRTGLVRPPSSFRKGTGTSINTDTDTGSVPVPLNTSVVLGVRPVTQQGLDGLRVRTAGPERQIADRSFYLQALRNRMTEVDREVQALATEAEKIKRDMGMYAALERKYEERMTEVRALEGQLADFNLAFDKIRTHTEVVDIKAQLDRIARTNELERRELDEVFMQRSETENKVKEVNEQLNELQMKAESTFSALGNAARQDYVQSLQNNQITYDQIVEKESIVYRLEDRIFALQTELKNETYASVHRTVKVVRREEALKAEQMKLEEESASALTPEQMRERLVQQAANDSQAVKQLERKLKQVVELIEKYVDDLQTKTSLAKDLASSAALLKKDETSAEKTKRVNEFLDSFPSEQESLLLQKSNLQQSIANILEFLSRNIMYEFVFSYF